MPRHQALIASSESPRGNDVHGHSGAANEKLLAAGSDCYEDVLAEEGSLDGLERAVDDGGQDEDGIRRSSRLDWHLIVISVLLTATLLLGSCKLLTVFALAELAELADLEDAPAATPNQAFFRRPSDDYILSSDWDFHAGPTVRQFNWVITDIVANPDGVYRPMTVINGLFPGELIRCNDGDTIVVQLENRSVNATAIHWHGMFQRGSNSMEGTPGVSQCPIAPGQSFRYEFKVQGQAGTYFYHSHQAAQHLDGLVGPLIVHSRGEKQLQTVPYVSDRVLLLQDWYYDLSAGLLFDSLSPGSAASPIPNGALINGQNVVDCSGHAARKCDNSTAVLPTISLTTHEAHRLRLINVGGFAWFDVTIDGHNNLAITEIDGTMIQPQLPGREAGILLAPGQRYSTIILANSTATDSFWLRARMIEQCFSKPALPENGVTEARAMIRYIPRTLEDHIPMVFTPPTTVDDSSRHITECKDMTGLARYSPIPARDAPAYAHESWYLELNLKVDQWRLERGFVNQSSFRPNLKFPSLHRIFQDPSISAESFDVAEEMVLSTDEVSVVDIILQNFDPGNHPFHLHGHYLWVLASGPGIFPGYESLGLKEAGKGVLDAHNSSILSNPLRRDVVTVEGKGWLLVRFIADNPGIWLLHCHMVWHGEAGMAAQFLSQLDVLRQQTLPEENLELCRVSVTELEKGAVPKDSIWLGHGG